MKIEVKPKEGRREILTVFLDGEPWRDVHTSVFGKHPKFPSCSAQADWQAIFDKFEYQRVKNYVIWRLSAQPYHSQQLQKLLRERLARPQTVDKVIKECLDAGYLNDESWLESFMRSQQKRNGLRAILAKLQAKGLSQEALQDVRVRWNQPEEEKNSILHLLRSRYRNKDMTDFRERQKVIASLMRKGFAFDQVKAALRSLGAEADELE